MRPYSDAFCSFLLRRNSYSDFKFMNSMLMGQFIIDFSLLVRG